MGEAGDNFIFYMVFSTGPEGILHQSALENEGLSPHCSGKIEADFVEGGGALGNISGVPLQMACGDQVRSGAALDRVGGQECGHFAPVS